MTSELAHAAPPPPRTQPVRKPGGFRIFLTRLVLIRERAWPAMLPSLGIIAALVILSLAGVWTLVPVWLHWTALVLAGAALAAALWRDIRAINWPTRREVQARLEEDSIVRHAPLQSLDDTPADPALATSPLWRAHLKASAERAKAIKRPKGRDTATARDPYGLRFLTIGLLSIALIASGSDWRSRMAGLFVPGATGASAAVADLWIEPPAYTGKAPIYLARAGEKKTGMQDQINAPAGAKVVAQVNGRGRRALIFESIEEKTRASFEKDKDAARAEMILTESGVLTMRLGAETMRWPVGVLPDAGPLVAFTKAPEETEQGLVAFGYISEDDYGLSEARLDMRLDPDQERPLDFPDFDEEAVNQTYSIVLEGAGVGERAETLDLQANPWAGLKVLAKVVVTDGAGQIGQSEERSFTLPARKFFNPLARAVVEQRQTLSVAADDWRRAGRSLDAVTMAPEVFYEDTAGDFLLLRAAFWRVMRQDGENFDDAVDEFWPLALQLEDGAVELARQRLEAAQEALREAIERGASDEEIARLTEELRQAMDDYLAALAQAGAQGQQSAGGGGQEIDKSNLDEMLDSIRDLAQSGAGNAARQLLSDLENLLNNLRMTQSGGSGGGGQGQGSGEGGGAAGQAGDLIGRQRELADEAFERGRNGTGEGEGQSAEDLADAERGLGEDLDDLIDELQDGDADPDGDAARAMGRARNNMREAEEALRNGDIDAASSAMERAIAQMREGAEGLAREEMRQAQEGEGGERAGSGGTDPLGRPVGEAYGQGVEVPEESDAARTRAVIDELRRRLGEPEREEEEIDYLERLLERF